MQRWSLQMSQQQRAILAITKAVLQSAACLQVLMTHSLIVSCSCLHCIAKGQAVHPTLELLWILHTRHTFEQQFLWSSACETEAQQSWLVGGYGGGASEQIWQFRWHHRPQSYTKRIIWMLHCWVWLHDQHSYLQHTFWRCWTQMFVKIQELLLHNMMSLYRRWQSLPCCKTHWKTSTQQTSAWWSQWTRFYASGHDSTVRVKGKTRDAHNCTLIAYCVTTNMPLDSLV